MKLTVKNFGPVKEAEVEVNNLNILMGDNNGGKTWLSYLVYGASDVSFFSFTIENNEHLPELKVVLEIPLIRNPFTQLYAINEKRENDKIYFQIIDQGKPDLNIKHLFNLNEIDFLLKKENITLEINSNIDFVILNDSTSSKELGQTKIYSNDLNSKTDFLTKEITIKTQFRDNINIAGIISSENRYFFSSERNGANLFHKAFDRKNSQIIQSLQNRSISSKAVDDTISYDSVKVAGPVSANINFTRDIEFYLVENAEIENNYILKIFEELIGGKFSKAPNAQITFDQEKDGNLIKVPLYLASSAARCLSDLYFYLKHLAKKNDVIFIDEPESHLTLDRQRIMAKLLVAIANAGVKVWVTTHSDFMVREVNNLIKLSSDLPGKDAFLKEYKEEYTKQDCIKPDEVNMYNMVNGIVQKIAITEKGMASDSFLDLAIMKANEIGNAIDYYSDKAE